MPSAESLDDDALYRAEVTAPTDKVCGMSDRGRRRQTNEDAYWIDPQLRFLLLADGLGGLPAGEVASAVAVAEIASMLNDPGRPLGSLASEAVEERLRAAILSAHSCVLHEAGGGRGVENMATTVVAAWVTPTRVYTAHVGDSRAYVLRQGQVVYRTQDHSVAADLVRTGVLEPARAQRHPEAHLLTMVLGGESDEDPVAEFDALALKPGDVVVLCSDGLWGLVSEEEMGEVAARKTTAAERGGELMRRALEAGGDDNITFVLYEHS